MVMFLIGFFFGAILGATGAFLAVAAKKEVDDSDEIG